MTYISLSQSGWTPDALLAEVQHCVPLNTPPQVEDGFRISQNILLAKGYVTMDLLQILIQRISYEFCELVLAEL